MKKESKTNSIGRVNLHKPRITISDGIKIVEHYCIVCGIFHKGHTSESCFKNNNKNI